MPLHTPDVRGTCAPLLKELGLLDRLSSKIKLNNTEDKGSRSRSCIVQSFMQPLGKFKGRAEKVPTQAMQNAMTVLDPQRINLNFQEAGLARPPSRKNNSCHCVRLRILIDLGC